MKEFRKQRGRKKSNLIHIGFCLASYFTAYTFSFFILYSLIDTYAISNIYLFSLLLSLSCGLIFYLALPDFSNSKEYESHKFAFSLLLQCSVIPQLVFGPPKELGIYLFVMIFFSFILGFFSDGVLLELSNFLGRNLKIAIVFLSFLWLIAYIVNIFSNQFSYTVSLILIVSTILGLKSGLKTLFSSDKNERIATDNIAYYFKNHPYHSIVISGILYTIATIFHSLGPINPYMGTPLYALTFYLFNSLSYPYFRNLRLY